MVIYLCSDIFLILNFLQTFLSNVIVYKGFISKSLKVKLAEMQGYDKKCLDLALDELYHVYGHICKSKKKKNMFY